MHRYIKHFLSICVLFTCIATLAYQIIHSRQAFNPNQEHGWFVISLLCIFHVLWLNTWIFTCVNIAGLICFNNFPDKPVLKQSLRNSALERCMCFRVVTRGTYPQLVKTNIQRNIKQCTEFGLSNYVFEVVTDKLIGIKEGLNVREVVVPDSYQTKHGSRYKARALQYCLEEGVNILSDNDWIIHLDEETLITESSLIGVINFINDGQYEFGQGVITYANEEIVCWIATLADSVRVGVDYGMLRFSLGILHRPMCNWKGSFIVANAGAERSVSFDFGPEGSITEDCYFGMKAWEKGYRFNFIEGEMWEKSTFSIMDYIRQRRRWVLGISRVFLSPNIKFPYRWTMGVLTVSQLSLPIILLGLCARIPLHPTIHVIVGSSQSAVIYFLFVFGSMKSFSNRRPGWCFYLFLCLIMCPVVLIVGILEMSATYWAVFSQSQTGFHIVDKGITEKPDTVHIV
ncbi:beta-1,4-mannosyltransferase egh [Patella vulgata]|uniref:beta-1,4-mannosyltransferase egh n=1 Tax=Patella vulgata TaxID=6465 RepID=UPI00217FF608|nr:beta-1,4-mannosyltransferase egh [Patella vulgata]